MLQIISGICPCKEVYFLHESFESLNMIEDIKKKITKFRLIRLVSVALIFDDLCDK
jgi:hypothetical protein